MDCCLDSVGCRRRHAGTTMTSWLAAAGTTHKAGPNGGSGGGSGPHGEWLDSRRTESDARKRSEMDVEVGSGQRPRRLETACRV